MAIVNFKNVGIAAMAAAVCGGAYFVWQKFAPGSEHNSYGSHSNA